MISAIMGSPTFGQVSQLLNEADYKAGGCFDKKTEMVSTKPRPQPTIFENLYVLIGIQ
jgi:hypothetical protein